MKVRYGKTGEFIFDSVVRFLKRKRVLPAKEYKALDDESRALAFTVSGYTSLEILQTFLDTLTRAAEEGTTKEQFRKDMDSFLKDHGYDGLNPWKSDTIFRTNMQTAFNAGHYKSMTDPVTKKLRPYWQYRTAGDSDVRESHAAMEGKVFRADDPVWDIWYPPNGFRCRCGVVSLTKSQVERKGLPVESRIPFNVDYGTGEIIPVMPDKGFSNNPAKVAWKPDMKEISPELRKIFNQRENRGKGGNPHGEKNNAV
ncbi:MAG: minor capsid protein [Hungatella sp.]|nr:minor capsid protein [Dorea sp.]MCI9636219.1 minor capsid protein [Hungatella sp.]